MQTTPILIPMEDDLVHTVDHPTCDDPTCPCQADQLEQRAPVQQPEKEQTAHE